MSVFYGWQGNNNHTTNNVRLINLVETTNSSFLPPNIKTLLLSTAYYKHWQDVSELELLYILQAMSVLYICLKPPSPPFFHQISGPSCCLSLIHLSKTTNSSFLPQNIRTLLLSTAYYKQWQDVSELETFLILQAMSDLYSWLKQPTPPFFHQISGPSYCWLYIIRNVSVLQPARLIISAHLAVVVNYTVLYNTT